MACDETRAQLFAYLDHELPSSEAERVRVHLARCPACRMLAVHDRRFLAAVRHAGGRTVESAPASLRERIRTSLDAVDDAPPA